MFLVRRSKEDFCVFKEKTLFCKIKKKVKQNKKRTSFEDNLLILCLNQIYQRKYKIINFSFIHYFKVFKIYTFLLNICQFNLNFVVSDISN